MASCGDFAPDAAIVIASNPSSVRCVGGAVPAALQMVGSKSRWLPIWVRTRPFEIMPDQRRDCLHLIGVLGPRSYSSPQPGPSSVNSVRLSFYRPGAPNRDT